MRALLDEQLSPQIAVLLGQAGYDVVAVAERDELAGRSDRSILEAASSEQRAVVTDNVKDFRGPPGMNVGRSRDRRPVIVREEGRVQSVRA
ncbi:MAG: DUF5615 family PIN-like protein [Acidimicrobiales bacterium]